MIIAPRRDEAIINGAQASLRLAKYLEDNADLVNQLTSNTDEYATSNVTTSRALNADTATLAQLSDVVGTLLADLKKAGII